MPRPSQALLDEGFFTFKKKAGEGLCWVKGCANPCRADRCMCSKCYMRRWRAKAKQTADFCTLRDHARSRGLAFDISPEYWRGLTDGYGFYNPDEDHVLTIDRVKAHRGYVEGNLRIVSVSVNSFKSNRERYLPEHVQDMLDRKRRLVQEENAAHLAMDPEEPEEPEIWDESEWAEDDPGEDPF